MPRGRSPAASPQDSLQRSVSPRTTKSKSQSPSVERDTPRHNGNDSRRSRSLSRSRVYSRSRSRSWSPGVRWNRSRTFSPSPSPNNSQPRSSKVRISYSSLFVFLLSFCWYLLKIVIEKLTKNVTGAHLREVFGSFGEIQSIDLPMNRACKQRTTLLFLHNILIYFSYDKSGNSIYPVLRSSRCRSGYRPYARIPARRRYIECLHSTTQASILTFAPAGSYKQRSWSSEIRPWTAFG